VSSTDEPIHDQLLVDALSRKGDALRELFVGARKVMLRMVADLDAGLHRRELAGDAVSRAFELLMSRPADSFDPARGTALSYIRTVVRTAVRDVRAENTQAGVRTRDYGARADDDQPKTDNGTWNTHQLREIPPERSADGGLEEMADTIAVEDSLADSPVTARAIRLIGWDGYSMGEAADATDVNRFFLKRRLAVWANADGREILAS
jgi:DNA-directed RNA polymerase specialized sigma24 family protein